MKQMRSSLPIFILVGLALVSVVGLMVLEASSSSAVIEVNNTSREDVPLAVYEISYGLWFGIGALILLVAGYFALKSLT